MNKIMYFTMIIMVAAVSVNCASMSVSRVDANKEIALTDKWNDEDSRLVAKQMVTEMFEFPWLKRFNKKHSNKRPTIVIQKIRNKSHEHIAIDTFVNDIKKEIMKNDIADFIVSGAERDSIRNELSQQQTFASEDSAMEIGEEQGANFALSGTINSMVDQLDGKKVTFYQIDMKLINLQTTREAWIGQKKIKKFAKRNAFSF